jgi:hypothetical protein
MSFYIVQPYASGPDRFHKATIVRSFNTAAEAFAEFDPRRVAAGRLGKSGAISGDQNQCPSRAHAEFGAGRMLKHRRLPAPRSSALTLPSELVAVLLTGIGPDGNEFAQFEYSLAELAQAWHEHEAALRDEWHRRGHSGLTWFDKNFHPATATHDPTRK